MANPSPSSVIASPRFLAISCAAFAVAIFTLDTLAPVEVTAGVLYIIVVLMAVRFCRPRGVVAIAVGCIALIVCSQFLSPGDPWTTTALINSSIEICAIGIATVVALKNQSAAAALQRAELDRVTRLMTLGELSASIAHEVNQPLSAVVTNGEVCLRWLAHQPPDLERAKQSVDRIVRDGSRAGEILHRVRAMAKGAPARKDWLDINETISQTIALAAGEIQRNEISLRATLATDLSSVPGDRIQLQQVLLNLLFNAIEAMSTVDRGSRELLVRSQKYGLNSVLIAVQDSGTGIASESLDRVFDAFHTTKPNGMGMGLAICRSIIDAHGGRLWVTNNALRGATFQFTLPSDVSIARRTA
ncbi:MAG TPA: ATP-binding protein [Pseudolabrys sp.]|jgi:signal transduction histidine kinase|nr:ATP-binding protein [Pseudolabrys sp.]